MLVIFLVGPPGDCLTVQFLAFILDVHRGEKKEHSEGDSKRAESAILGAIRAVEKKVQSAVESEVNTIFHELEDHHKSDIEDRAKKAVEKGAKKVKKQVDEKAKGYPYEIHYPYQWPHVEKKTGKHGKKDKVTEHKDHRILHAVEAAEQAVIHAIQEEVDTIFHESEHHEDTKKKAKSVVEEGVNKAKKEVEDTHEHRRVWVSGEGISSDLEEYNPLF